MTGIISAIFVSFSILIQISAQDAPIVEAFVKSGAADGDGKTFDAPIGSLNDAYDLLTDESEGELTIKVIKANDENNALEAEAITFNKTSGITIEGITEAEGTNEKAEIDCAITAENDLFKCEKTVTFKNLIFDFTTKQEDEGELIANADGLALIHADAESTSLTISNCEFKETTPENTCGMLSNAGEEVKFHLVKVSAGSLTIDTVECTSESELKFSATPFLIDGATTAVTAVSLTSLKLSKITSSSSAAVKIVGKTDAAISVKVDGCTFTDCVSSSPETATSGALYVESSSEDSTFTIENNGITTFTKCTCANGKSGGIYLKMDKIGDASKLKWPTTGSNLVFSGCAANSSRSTGLYLEVKAELHENIADAMKSSFAAGYTLENNRWFVVAKGADTNDVDFTLKYFDQPTEVFVKSEGEGEGVSRDGPIGSLKEAYDLLSDTNEGGLSIKVINGDGETSALKPEAMTLDKASEITIEGITEAEGANEKAKIDCSITGESDLFTCKKTVAFKNLIFVFSANLEEESNESESNDEGTFALVSTGSESTSLTISNCEFKQTTPANTRGMLSNAEEEVKFHLIKVSAGSLTIDTVECISDKEVKFSVTPFLIEGAVTSVSLKSLNLKKITSKESPVVKIVGKDEAAVSVKLDSCTFTECVSNDATETTSSGALHVKSKHAGSTFSVEDNGKTKFDGCACAKGKSGAIYLEMTAITEATQLSWPTTGTNLEFTGCKVSEEDATSNTEKNTALYLNVPVKIHRDIAKEMKKSFASGYKKNENKGIVVAKGTDDSSEVDFTEVYFDPITDAYVSAKEDDDNKDGLSYATPKKKLDSAYKLFGEGVGEENFKVNIIKTDAAYKAEAITLDKLSLLTIVGVQKTDEANGEAEVIETEVEIDCDAKSNKDLFTCKKKVEFRSLVFNFPSTLEGEQAKNDGPEVTGPFALIATDGEDAELSIVKCRFVRPTPTDKLGMLSNADEETVGIHLVKVSAGTLTVNEVECSDETNTAKFTVIPFLVEAATVSLKSLNLKKITSTTSAVVKIVGKTDAAISVKVDGCTFTECSSSDETATSGALYVESENAGSSFEIGDTGATTFTKCTCENGKSGGIYLKMTEIGDASKLSWPTTGTNLAFTECTAEETDPTSNAEKNTGLYLEVKTELHENIADEMKKSFAAGYTLNDYRWFVAAKGESDADVDFTLKYFDRPTEVFVKSGGKGEGVRKEAPIGSLKGAYELLAETSDQGFSIKVIKAETETTALKPDAMTLDKTSGITIEGITEAEGANEKAKIDCTVTAENDLFTCEKTVAFKNLIFDFSATITQDEGELKANADGLALIHADAESTSLSILNCDFVRPTTGDIVGIHLVKVSAGSLKMTGAKCIDDEKTVLFKAIPFLVEGAKEVVIEDVEVKKVEVEEGAAMSIKNGIKGEGKENKKNEGTEEIKGTVVVVEGVKMEEVKSKSGKTAGVEIALGEENSKVKMGREKACTFKECKAENGKSGAIYIEMKHVSGNLELPGENKLEIDGTNSGKGNSGASLCIVAADFDAFSKQDNAFEFAKNYDEREAGWVVGAADENAEPEDVYEKYLKEKKDPEPEPEPGKKDERKANAGVIAVAVVVPIVFVIAVVVIVIVVMVVVKKRRSKYNSDGVGKDKEQEMSNNV
ncbi:uncharacterized protein MONOS_16064 [Monocercomonoides exilis]|uniref:uncharacterized protein n=1 Tax=Monocercomonoides exilis TaxID=2049356 RepID=UPI003559E8A5|nr:hypothetical protein MONOS_16064 [Monocercomonoides exilis]